MSSAGRRRHGLSAQPSKAGVAEDYNNLAAWRREKPTGGVKRSLAAGESSANENEVKAAASAMAAAYEDVGSSGGLMAKASSQSSAWPAGVITVATALRGCAATTGAKRQ